MVVSEEYAMEQEHGNTQLGHGDATEPEASASGQKHTEPQTSANDFHPIRIKGEPLSVTVLRDRR
jgi:hypothetical protein